MSADVKPRFNLKTDHPVEQFYKRHMTNDQPIPQIIVVGILRVLLTTCPNNAKNAGGIDLHSEWSSCLNFMLKHREFFLSRGFESKVFAKTNEILQNPSLLKAKPTQNEKNETKEEADEQEKEEVKEDAHFANLPEYQFEMDRHRVIVAMVIADFFVLMLKHFKANHVVQFMYLS